MRGPWASLAVKPIDAATVTILGYTKLNRLIDIVKIDTREA